MDVGSKSRPLITLPIVTESKTTPSLPVKLSKQIRTLSPLNVDFIG